MTTIVLAFDIERSGATNDHHTIGIGASVVNGNFEELDQLFLPGHIPDETNFEQRCWDEFWSKYPDKLKELEYHGDKDMQNRQEEMITQFQKFRAKWEDIAKENGWTLELVSDNNVYDGGFINEMLFTHTNELPIPYNTKGKYKPFWETHSEQRGLLMAVDPSFTSPWGFTKRIAELYDVPEMKVSHDHNPANDAYTIAFEHQVLFGIRDGRIKRRS
uniref:Exonuclease n=1 Tax=viral metagenome TaxID=1070528 RepID=A0A6C0EKZ9_9ZZZZ